jgi:hypothetical protein
VHDQANVRLIDTHSKRVGGCNHTQLAVVELLLHLLFCFRLETRMVMRRCEALFF